MALAPVVLTGDIIQLEPLTHAHTDQLEQIALDPELWRLTVTRIVQRSDVEEYIAHALAAQASGTALPFVTIARSANQVIGSTRFANYDPANRRVEIGWTWIAGGWQRSGANVEAKLLMMTHAFESLGCHRVEFKTDVLNEKSRNALRGIGAQEEGILRAHTLLWSGRWRDTIYYSVLAPEWPAVKLRLQQRINERRSKSNGQASGEDGRRMEGRADA